MLRSTGNFNGEFAVKVPIHLMIVLNYLTGLNLGLLTGVHSFGPETFAGLPTWIVDEAKLFAVHAPADDLVL